MYFFIFLFIFIFLQETLVVGADPLPVGEGVRPLRHQLRRHPGEEQDRGVFSSNHNHNIHVSQKYYILGNTLQYKIDIENVVECFVSACVLLVSKKEFFPVSLIGFF